MKFHGVEGKVVFYCRSGPPSASTKLSCIKTELKRCLSDKYDISRKKPDVQSRLKWWRRRGHLHWTHRWIPLRWAEKYTSWWGSYISPLYEWQRGLLRRRQTEQKTTNKKLTVCSLRWRPKSKVCLLVMVSMLGRLAFCRPVWSNPLVPL